MRPLILTVAVILVASCGPTAPEAVDKRRAAVSPEVEKIEVAAVSSMRSDGAIVGTFDAATPNSQIIEAPVGSRIEGARLRILPGSFDVNFELRLEEGGSLASRSNLKALGYAESALIEASGPAVYVHWTYDEDSYRPIHLRLPGPSDPGLRLSSANLVVLFLKNIPNGDGQLLGSLPASSLKIEGQTVALETHSHGVYQAVYLNAATSGPREVRRDEPNLPPVKSGDSPSAFAIVGPTAVLSGARVTVSWEPSAGASSYELKLDAKSRACADPYKTLTLSGTATKVEGLRDGTSYACVEAINSNGRVPASNNGFAFAADASPPPVPGRPSVTATPGTDIGYGCSWPTVSTDVGPAGFSHYLVAIGTTAGGSDQFNGPIAEETSRQQIGFKGETYHCRVKSVDKAGNESAWSASASFRLPE